MNDLERLRADIAKINRRNDRIAIAIDVLWWATIAIALAVVTWKEIHR